MKRAGGMERKGLGRTLIRSLLLKCPRCGRGSLFEGFFSMRSNCPACSLEFEREQGYFVGAIYINYAATIIIALPGFLLLDTFTNIPMIWQMGLWISFAVLFPLLFFRHSRSLWLALDSLFNPPERRQRSGKIKSISEARKRRDRSD